MLVIRDAVLSKGEQYRYALERKWDHNLPKVLWVMLNPSTADAYRDDATIRRCIDYSQQWGYGSLQVGNLYAFRATQPSDLWAQQASGRNVVGRQNDTWLARMAVDAGIIIVAWGSQAPRPRAAQVYDHLRQLNPKIKCLGHTVTLQPVHPLRQPKTAKLKNWRPLWREVK